MTVSIPTWVGVLGALIAVLLVGQPALQVAPEITRNSLRQIGLGVGGEPAAADADPNGEYTNNHHSELGVGVVDESGKESYFRINISYKINAS